MAEMLSWHRVGQKVTPFGDQPWGHVSGPGSYAGSLPQDDEIYEISGVRPGRVAPIVFNLVGFEGAAFNAEWFRPVYPEIVDQLRRLETPAGSPERVLEGV